MSRYFIDNTTGQPDGKLGNSDPEMESLAGISIKYSKYDALSRKSPSDMSEETSSLATFLGEHTPYWKFLLTELVETHSEGHSTSKSMSDCYTSFSTGGEPVNVAVSGNLYTTQKYDYRLDFMALYDAFFRGSQQAYYDLYIEMFVENTIFAFKPGDFSYVQGSSTPDFTPFSIKGFAYAYRVGKETVTT